MSALHNRFFVIARSINATTRSQAVFAVSRSPEQSAWGKAMSEAISVSHEQIASPRLRGARNDERRLTRHSQWTNWYCANLLYPSFRRKPESRKYL